MLYAFEPTSAMLKRAIVHSCACRSQTVTSSAPQSWCVTLVAMQHLIPSEVYCETVRKLSALLVGRVIGELTPSSLGVLLTTKDQQVGGRAQALSRVTTTATPTLNDGLLR